MSEKEIEILKKKTPKGALDSVEEVTEEGKPHVDPALPRYPGGSLFVLPKKSFPYSVFIDLNFLLARKPRVVGGKSAKYGNFAVRK